MAKLVSLDERWRRAVRDRRAAEARSLSRRAMGPLFFEYLRVEPSVYSARGELYGLRLVVPRSEALERLRGRLILTLDSATEVYAGFRFGKAASEYAYADSTSILDEIETERIAERRPGSSFPLTWNPPGQEMLFVVVPRELPELAAVDGKTLISKPELVRDLIGFYGLRQNLLIAIDTRLRPEHPKG
jgi:hypothetical protein